MSAISDIARKTVRHLASIGMAGLMWILLSESALACERCFGAGSDAQMVKAIGASMMLLIVLMGFVGGGIFSFFNRAQSRASEIEEDSPVSEASDALQEDQT